MSNNKVRVLASLIVGLLMFSNMCASESFYKLTDFHSVSKIDAHVHVNTKNSTFVELAKKNNFKLISINVDYPDFPPIDEQLDISIEIRKKNSASLAFATTFSMNKWNDKTWSQTIISQIQNGIREGAIAVKVWKNVGMDFKDINNQLVMLDNPKFKPIFNFLSEERIPLIGHQGEPKNCWLPVSDMTVTNDQIYFTTHPQYHMYLHPEFPSYEDHIKIRDNVLNNHPKLNFVGAHLASLEWSVDELSMFLDRNPQAYVDTAARMGQIQFQSQREYKKVRDFFIKYQDRLLYATDLTHQPEKPIGEEFDKAFSEQVEARWRTDWEYLTSANTMKTEEVKDNFEGLRLPTRVINKLYKENTLKAFNRAFK